MATLDTFGIVFKEEGLGALTSKLKGFQGTLAQITGEYLKMTAGITAGYFALQRFTSGSIASVQKFDMLAKTTGIAVDKLEGFARASQLINPQISTEQAMSQIQSLQSNITNLLSGLGGDATGFQMAGINIRSGNALNVISQIRDSIQGLSDVRSVALLEKMGISRDFLPVLKATNAEFQKLTEGKFLSKQQRENVALLGKEFQKLKFATLDVRNEIVSNLAPALSTQLQRAVEWLQNNTKGLTETFNFTTKVLGGFASGLLDIAEMAGKLLNTQYGLPALSIAGALLASRFMPLTTTLTLVYLALQDVAGFFQGKDSLTGRIVEWFQSLDKGTQTVLAMAPALLALARAMQVLNLAVNASILGKLGTVAKIAGLGLGAIGLGSAFFGKAKEQDLENISQNLNLSTPQSIPQNLLSNSIANGDKNLNMQSTINVNGASNPEEVARLVNEILKTDLQNLSDELL